MSYVAGNQVDMRRNQARQINQLTIQAEMLLTQMETVKVENAELKAENADLRAQIGGLLLEKEQLLDEMGVIKRKKTDAEDKVIGLSAKIASHAMVGVAQLQ